VIGFIPHIEARLFINLSFFNHQIVVKNYVYFFIAINHLLFFSNKGLLFHIFTKSFSSSLAAGALTDILGPQKIIGIGSLFGVFAIATYLKIKD